MPLRILPALALGLLLAARAGAEEIVVYSPHGTDIRDQFTAAFRLERPDVEVRWLDMGAASILERVRAESDAPSAQVWWGAPATFFTLAAREGLLRPYRPTWAEKVPEYARGEGDLWYGQFDLPIGIGYVSDRIPPDRLPKNWDDLVRADAAGRLLIRDPPASGTMKTFLAAMVLRAPDEAAGFAWLAELHARTQAYAADPTLLFQMLARGEGDLTVWNVTDLLFQRARYGYPFEVILPPEGVPVITDSIALLPGAGEAAEAFYEFVTSVESNLLLARDHYRLPTRTDLPAESRPRWMEGLSYRPLDLPRERMISEMEEITTRWEREVRTPHSATLFPALALLASLLRRWRRAHENV